MSRLLLLTGLVFVGQCGSPISPATTSVQLEVVSAHSEVQLTNASASTTFFFICESDTAALINWRASVDPAVCASVSPGAQVAVPDSAIMGSAPGKQAAIVWWWRAEKSPAGPPVPGVLHSVAVRF
jgi:hypothetical protein